MQQSLSFLGNFQHRLCFGGSLLKNSHAKKARPLSSKKSIHIYMRSKYAKGSRSFLKQERWIGNLARKIGRQKGVKIYRLSTSGSDLSLLVKFSKRREFFSFLRAFSGLLARKTLKAEKGTARRADTYYKKSKGAQTIPSKQAFLIPRGDSFWDQRPFTRIVDWGDDHQALSSLIASRKKHTVGFLSQRHVDALSTPKISERVQKQLMELMDSS